MRSRGDRGDEEMVDEDTGQGERRGLGKVVYSQDPAEVREERVEVTGADDDVEEASEESFPASDPPAYAKGHAEDARISPGSQAETEAGPSSEAVLRMAENETEEQS